MASPRAGPARSPLVVFALLCIACGGGERRHVEPESDVDAAVSAPLLPVVRAELERLGEGRFELVSFRTGRVRTRPFVDGMRYRATYLLVDVEAELKFTADGAVPGAKEVQARATAGELTLAQVRRAVEERGFLGEGPFRAGSMRPIRGVAVFDEVEGGWAFRLFDGRGGP